MSGRQALLLATLAACAAPRAVAPLRYVDPPLPTVESLALQAAPPIGPVAELALPVPQETVLPNGVRLVFLERHDAPAVSVRLLIPRPFDPGDAASVRLQQMAFLFSHGSGDVIARRLGTAAGAGLSVNEAIGEDELVWSAHGPSPALDLACELVERRSFGAGLSADEYNRRGDEWLRAAHLGKSASFPAERYVLFGDQHPYGYAGLGRRLESLEEAVRLRAALLQPTQATLLVVGDATFAQVQESARRWFGGLVATAPPAPVASPPSPAPDFVPDQLVFAPWGGFQQFCSIVGQGPLARPEDAEALLVLSHLVSDPGSPLFEEVRGDLGATYGIHGTVMRQRFATWISISGHYVRGKELEAMSAGLTLLKRIRTGDIHEDEIQRAQEEAVGRWRGALSTIDGTANAYAEVISRGEELASVAEQPERLRRVGREALSQAAARYLAPDRLHVVVTGAPTGLEEIGLGLGRAHQVHLFW